MIEAYTFDDIKGNVKESLNHPITITKRVPVVEKLDAHLHWMNPTDPKPEIKYQEEKLQINIESKLIGILFCHPFSPIGKDEIVKHLSYFHHRSGKMSDFFWAGYGAYWAPECYADQKLVANVDGTDWFFSDLALNQLRLDVEAECNWKYSGEAELILLSAHKEGEEVKFDFDNAISCNLELMENDNAFSSVRSFFEKIFRFADNYVGESPVWDLSDSQGFSQGKKNIADCVLSLLPEQLRDFYKSTRHYAIVNLSKKP